jgi:hypothetical protein
VLSDKDTIVKKKNIKNIFPLELGLNRKKFWSWIKYLNCIVLLKS